MDSHTLLWWISNPENLGVRAKQQIKIAQKTNSILISAVSVWEISLLEQKKRIALEGGAEQWFHDVTSLPEITVQPLDFTIVRTSMKLANYPYADPVDRFILATAQLLGIPLVTKDARMHGYEPVETIW
ncbi:MAG: type II toxin-antitoxin system VapC family toxin [bacterium]|nr:type II toxin-antitoxin system VapC family toxin [bacterium]